MSCVLASASITRIATTSSICLLKSTALIPSVEWHTKRPNASYKSQLVRFGLNDWNSKHTVEGDTVALPHNTNPFNVIDLLRSRK